MPVMVVPEEPAEHFPKAGCLNNTLLDGMVVIVEVGPGDAFCDGVLAGAAAWA